MGWGGGRVSLVEFLCFGGRGRGRGKCLLGGRGKEIYKGVGGSCEYAVDWSTMGEVWEGGRLGLERGML